MLDELKKYMNVNLQLFAEPDDEDEEDIDDDGYAGNKDEGELEDTNVDNPDDEEKELEDDEDPTGDDEDEKPEKKQPAKKPMDKKDHAIIKAKQEAKQLRDELAKIKQVEEDRKAEQQKEQLKKKLIDNGYTEEEAADRAEEKSKVAKLEKELRSIKYGNQADKLSNRFPDIYENLDNLVDICEKTGWSLEKVAKAELEESSEYDIKTKTEQEALLRRQKAADKKVIPGSTKEPKQTKLSAQDERTYQNMIKLPRYKNYTRQQIAEILKEEE